MLSMKHPTDTGLRIVKFVEYFYSYRHLTPYEVIHRELFFTSPAPSRLVSNVIPKCYCNIFSSQHDILIIESFIETKLLHLN
jgi:hypothetical protein